MVSGVLDMFDDAVLRLLMKRNITERGARWNKADLFLGRGEEKREEPRSHNPLQGPTAVDVAFFHHALLPNVSTASQGPILRIKLVINTLAFLEDIPDPNFSRVCWLPWVPPPLALRIEEPWALWTSTLSEATSPRCFYTWERLVSENSSFSQSSPNGNEQILNIDWL